MNWLLELPQVRRRAGREEILATLHAVIRFVEGFFENNPLDTYAGDKHSALERRRPGPSADQAGGRHRGAGQEP